MEQMVEYQSYEEYKQAVNTVLNRIGGRFCTDRISVETGKGTDILKNSGYQQCQRICLGGI